MHDDKIVQTKGEYNFLTKGHIFPKLHYEEFYNMLINVPSIF